MYRRNARKDYLNLAKCKKRTGKKIRKAIKQQLQYIRRDRKYIDELLDTECELTPKQTKRLAVIDKVYEQQKYMYEHKVHSVPDRIAVERAFALAKQKYGLGLITSRLDKTTRCSIALSVIAMNVDRLCRSLLRLFYDIVFSRYKQHEFMLILIQNNNVENLVCC